MTRFLGIHLSSALRGIPPNVLGMVVDDLDHGMKAIPFITRDHGESMTAARLFRAHNAGLTYVERVCPWHFDEQRPAKRAFADTRYHLMVAFQPDGSHRVRYLRRPFRREPDFGVTSVTYDFAELFTRGEEPA